MDVLDRLIAETEAGASYALDVEIAQALVPQIIVMRRNSDDTGNEPHTYRCFSTKLDDALWLGDALVPGCFWHVAKGRLTASEPLFGCQLLFGADEVLAEGEGPTAPIAVLLAVLRARRALGKEQP